MLLVINTLAHAPPVSPLARRPGAEGTAWGEAGSGWRAAFCQCKQIISVCLGGGGWGRELSWALLCSEKKRQKIWVTNHKLFCFRHNWHKQAFSLWFLAGRGLGWLGWEGRGLRLAAWPGEAGQVEAGPPGGPGSVSPTLATPVQEHQLGPDWGSWEERDPQGVFGGQGRARQVSVPR